ncbi:40S ribosomal protein S15a-1-like [Rosa chinensis]|uniref:40S ribosomal protein S15a-1-like n=1 Tax=Rosa chinensis TaxID=74649 RepID=UPI000D08EA10|nr:40S ribosomal protein S15a-1-like [Rosa chinensis]
MASCSCDSSSSVIREGIQGSLAIKTVELQDSAATMVRVSVLNDALKSMYNAEKRGKCQVMYIPPIIWSIYYITKHK